MMATPFQCRQAVFLFFFSFIQILMHDRKSGIWVAKIAEQALVQRLPKKKQKNKQTENNPKKTGKKKTEKKTKKTKNKQQRKGE